MKSTVFHLDQASATFVHRLTEKHEYEFEIPVLKAYAIEYFIVEMLVDGGSLYTGDYDVNNGKLIVEGPDPRSMNDYRITLTIHYHGIRDYSLLFPAIPDASLKERLGQFYREADAAFETGSWLTFTLMCGALFEGVLYAKAGVNKSFNVLIDDAHANGDIDVTTSTVMHTVRGHRNLVHANRHTEPYVSRADAMDTRVILDKLLRRTI